MTIRLALLRTRRSEGLDGVEAVLRDMVTQVALTVIEAAPGTPLRTLRRLLAAQPHIVVAQAGSPQPPPAAKLYRLLAPQSRLVLATGDMAPSRRKRRRVDAVVRDAEELRRAVDRLRAQLARPSPSVADLDQFRLSPLRPAATAHRVLYMGDLSPTSSAPDVLIALAAWAEANRHRTAEIWWAAEGYLSGVLAAQPLPPNLTQQFHGTVARQDLPDLMARCGVLVAATEAAPILEAWTAGLVVVASRRVLTARLLLRGDSPGWLFDPARPEGLAEALGQVLACDPARLDRFREHGQRLASELAAQDVKRPAIAEFLLRSPMMGSKTVAS